MSFARPFLIALALHAAAILAGAYASAGSYLDPLVRQPNPQSGPLHILTQEQ